MDDPGGDEDGSPHRQRGGRRAQPCAGRARGLLGRSRAARERARAWRSVRRSRPPSCPCARPPLPGRSRRGTGRQRPARPRARRGARNNARIDTSMGRAVGEVLEGGSGPRFTTGEGAVLTPEKGVFYPRGLSPASSCASSTTARTPSWCASPGAPGAEGLLPVALRIVLWAIVAPHAWGAGPSGSGRARGVDGPRDDQGDGEREDGEPELAAPMSPRQGGTRADSTATRAPWPGCSTASPRASPTPCCRSFAQDVRCSRATRASGPGMPHGHRGIHRRARPRCLASDFSLGMLRTGLRARRQARPRPVPFVAADALHLPLPDACVDAVVISFGLRNTVDVDAALAEFARVTRPVGALVVCEFWAHLRAVPPRLHRLPHGGPAPRGPRGELEPRRVRLPRRVDPRLGPTSPPSPPASAPPAGARWPGATSPAGVVAPSTQRPSPVPAWGHAKSTSVRIPHVAGELPARDLASAKPIAGDHATRSLDSP